MNILELQKMKSEGKKISMVTSYDYWGAQILNETDIDCLLVGDSLAQVIHGYPSTILKLFLEELLQNLLWPICLLIQFAKVFHLLWIVLKNL